MRELAGVIGLGLCACVARVGYERSGDGSNEPPPECVDNADCPDVCVRNRCVVPQLLGECDDVTDCPSNLECRDEACVKIDTAPCASNAECGGTCLAGVCSQRAGPGNPCDDPGDCTGGVLCQGGICDAGGLREVFRSVGPGRETPVVASDGALSVLGTSAVFAVPLPANVGVGDVLTYDIDPDGVSDVAAVIEGRVSDTELAVIDFTGAVPFPVAGTSTWEISRAYTSLAAAIAGDENPGLPGWAQDFDRWGVGNDLVGRNLFWNIACYADGVDAANVTVSDWITSPTQRLRIYTPVSSSEVGTSQRHNGTWASPGYHISTVDEGLMVSSSHVDVVGLKVEATGTIMFNAVLGVGLTSGASEITMSHNLVTAPTLMGTDILGFGNVIVAPGTVIRFYNNVLFDMPPMAICARTFQGLTYFFNNTVCNCGETGVSSLVDFSMVAVNNISRGSGRPDRDFHGVFGAGSGFNISGDNSSTGAATDRMNTAISFEDADSGDCHLAASDTAAMGTATDASGLTGGGFTDDIDGDPRGASWDVGADQR